MSDRANRVLLGGLGVLLVIGGGLAAATGAGAFGATRRHEAVFDHTVVRWWDMGGWMSYAVVVAIGLLLLATGLWMAVGQLRGNDGTRHLSRMTFQEDGVRGKTALRSAAGSRALENDLERLPHVRRAKIDLSGRHPNVELRALLSIDDGARLDRLSRQVTDALRRFSTTTGFPPDPVRVTLRYVDMERERQLV